MRGLSGNNPTEESLEIKTKQVKKMKELMNELKANASRAERFLIYGLGIFTAIGTVTVLIGIINQ